MELVRSKMEDSNSSTSTSALALSFDDHIRPLLDAVDRLRDLKVMQEGIERPTIVVVGDQSSGKSSVLESLAGISLPRGQGISTRVPLIMRLQHDPNVSEPELHLEYKEKKVRTSESLITEAINVATEEIAGSGKGISNTPLTLVVKKKGVPDLTMVDLPGITRVPVHGQPHDIYEQISTIIKEYITPKESIILNVLSATVDFPTCESIRMSQQVDATGDRTLAVVTKVDRAPEGLLAKVTVDAVNIGLGYVCVRNRVGDESYEEARVEEARLFQDHPLLSRIDKSIVGIPVLARRLMKIQASSIARCLPDIVKKINVKLSRSAADLDAMPKNLTTVADAMRTIMHMDSMSKEMLMKVLIRGEYDDDYEDDLEMHGKARLADMLEHYRKEIPPDYPATEDLFLMEEIRVLQETSGIGLPNFLPPNAFCVLLQRKVKGIAHAPRDFVKRVWGNVEDLAVKVLKKHSDIYTQLQSSTRNAAYNINEKLRIQSYQAVKVAIEMEATTNFTSNHGYLKTWSDLMNKLEEFLNVIKNQSLPAVINMDCLGKEVNIGHLRQYAGLVEQACDMRMRLTAYWKIVVQRLVDTYLRQYAGLVEQAYDMRMRLTAYWKIVVLRLVDTLGLHIVHSIKKLVEEEMEKEIVNELFGTGSNTALFDRMMEESFQLLQESASGSTGAFSF